MWMTSSQAAKNKEEVKGLYDHASKRLAKGAFRLRKWHMNGKELSRLIHETESSKSDPEICK